MKNPISAAQMTEIITAKLSHNFGVTPQEATNEHIYLALALVVRDLVQNLRRDFEEDVRKKQGKQVYYLCMEFLMGRSLKNNIYNLGLCHVVDEALKHFDVKTETLYEMEPDAGLGNGGLGRLAACFLDALATGGYPAMGYSLRYEFGIFRQKIVDGWQTELPDNWLPGGDVWLIPRPEQTRIIKFEGQVKDWWDGSYHQVEHINYTSVEAVPYDMYVPGKDGEGVSVLRLWEARAPGLDMNLFNQGDYLRAMEQNSMAEAITKVLYPSDNHREGKSLRLRQQYFLVSASIQDIIYRHLSEYSSLHNLPEKAAIQLNDTHPALAIPELMRIMLDECGFGWDEAWEIVTKTVNYTNHTVMKEALEVWPEDLFAQLLPRIHQIVQEINNREGAQMMAATGGNTQMVSDMAVISYQMVKMANLCVLGSGSVNGVSKLHSQIVKDTVFHNFYVVTPEKFKNVTNGIAHRRWLCQSNPGLTNLIKELIGDGFIKDASQLSKLKAFEKDATVLKRLEEVKRENKERLAAYVKKQNGVILNPDSIFDVQVKRLHEYKRQHLNALHILSLYQDLKENPNLDIQPRTFIFGAKAAPGYFLAKQIIRMICKLSEVLENDPAVRDKLRIVYLEDYRVTLAELLMPASEISEQISLAGTEASGTGNMKMMINGAVTLGTLDGANVEICDAVGEENMFLFGMRTPEVENLQRSGYNPQVYYNNNHRLRRAVDAVRQGFAGSTFDEVVHALLGADQYMVMADFEDYCRAQSAIDAVYADPAKFNRMSLRNVAGAGIFSADRAIADYARDIWHVSPLK